jgi:hypothetical protein
MKKESTDQKNEPIVIPDECGDSMWDEVLGQEIKVCDIKQNTQNPDALLNEIGGVQRQRHDKKIA